MADVYEMPAPKPPTDAEMDELAIQADELLSRIDVPAGARQVIRVQAAVIRKLRVALAKAEAERDSVQAVANMRRDMEVAATVLDMVADDERTAAEFGGESCPGVGTPPVAGTVRTPRDPSGYHYVAGRCSICDSPVKLEGEVIGEHTFGPGPAVRPARPAG